jgi:putative mRNA 3-end processing factor
MAQMRASVAVPDRTVSGMNDLVRVTAEGLYCPAGDFHIDPWRPVPRALITHAHADHARAGSQTYWCARDGEAILRLRLGSGARVHALDYGVPQRFGDAVVSLHPAGHILGSAQLRIEAQAQVWVVSGDYKRDADPTCRAFEPVRCDVFVTEATFALPVYRWPAPSAVAGEIHDWWQANAARGEASVLFCYALGKAQRVLAELTRYTDRTVFLHGAMPPLVRLYREAGVRMLPTLAISQLPRHQDYAGSLILAPPGAQNTPWLKRFAPYRTGFASGWMRVRGNRRRQSFDRGFELSDHADWPSLLRTIRETGARRVLATHGETDALVAQLRDWGIAAERLQTEYHGEDDRAEPATAE